MDAKQFDGVAKAIGQGNSRRRLLAGLVGAILAGSLDRATVTAEGKQQHRRRQGVKVEDDTLKPNGKKCTKDAQCRSDNCVGATGRGATGRCQCLSTCDDQACGADDGCGGKCQTGSCPNATDTCDQGTCCTEGNCTGAGQCCGDLVCNINYSSSTGYCTTCLSRQSKCDLDVGGCCGEFICKPVANNPSWCN